MQYFQIVGLAFQCSLNGNFGGRGRRFVAWENFPFIAMACHTHANEVHDTDSELDDRNTGRVCVCVVVVRTFADILAHCVRLCVHLIVH